jgi:hypothetical protein
LLPFSDLKLIILPRQAWDKHRETQKREWCFLTVGLPHTSGPKWSAQQGSALIVAQCSGSLGCMARYAGNFATGPKKMALSPRF